MIYNTQQTSETRRISLLLVRTIHSLLTDVSVNWFMSLMKAVWNNEVKHYQFKSVFSLESVWTEDVTELRVEIFCCVGAESNVHTRLS